MGEPCYCGLDITRMECVKTFVFQVRIELNDATDKSHGIESLGKSICRLRLIQDTFIFIRKERSSCLQKNLLEKMPKFFYAIQR
jgi:hypothetical protein